MLELHVWGYKREISVVFPECLAAAWLLAQSFKKDSFKIVTLSNTNLSKTGVLPILKTENESYEGYEAIINFVLENSANTGDILQSRDLTQSALILLIDQKLIRVHQFNLYSNLKNYEGYTRKLFKNYLPFPMMYNQPLKLYNIAQEQVSTAGLLPSSPGLFGVLSSGVHDDADDETSEVALSALHERQMTAKSNKRELLRQSKNSLKCLNYLGEILDDIVNLQGQLNSGETEDKFGLLFGSSKISVAEILLYAYIHALTFPQLPDRAINDYIKLRHPSFAVFAETKIKELNSALDAATFEGPSSSQAPSLLNEIKYRLGH